MRRILHVDMDAFYAAIEQRDDPSLRGRPVAVGSASARGVVATASYEARRYGVGSAMPSRRALELCPHLRFVPLRMGVYREVGERVREVLRSWTPLVEPLSLDEAYLDVTEPLRGRPSGTLIARAIKREILAATGLTASVGVSYCKFLAKIASDMDKPDGLVVIRPEDAEALIEALPVARVHGIGPRTAERLHAMGVRTGRELRRVPLARLEAEFGKHGRRYFDLARGIDERPVDPVRVRRSVSSETTFATDLDGIAELEAELPPLAADVARRLERVGAMGRSVVLKVKYADHRVVTRRAAAPLPLRAETHLCELGRWLLRERLEPAGPVRLLGLGAFDLVDGATRQPPLFPDWLRAAGRGAGSGSG